MTPADFGNIAGGIAGGGGLAWWLIRRAVGRVDRIEEKVQAIELAMVKELPSKEDFSQMTSRLDRVETLLQQVRDMTIRQDERSKTQHGE